MKNILAVVCLLIIAIFICSDILRPIHIQREYYQDELQHYANGINA